MANFDPYEAGEKNRKKRMADMIAPNAYTAKTKSEQANIDRRAKMIELLQGQADAPIEKFSYGGIEAVTPPAAYLAKILSGAMAGYQSGKAGQEQEALDKYKENAQNEDMATIREAASMPGTSLNLRPGTQATDLTQMNEYLLPGMEPFTGSIPARRNTTTTPGGSRAISDLTQEDRKAVEDANVRKEDARLELLREQFKDKERQDERKQDQVFRADESQKRIDAATAAAKLLADANAAKAEKIAANKPLPTAVSNKIDAQATTYINTKNLIDTFSDSYGNQDPAGVGKGGDFLVTMKGLFGDNDQTYQWWTAQKSRDALVRNNLFGASLTPGEQASWSKLTVNPNMSAATIKGNLLQQAEIERKALLRQSNALMASGYSTDVIEAYLGDTVENLGISLMPKTAKSENPAATKPTVDNKSLDSFQNPSDGQTYTRPANMTDEEWQRYKIKEGGK